MTINRIMNLKKQQCQDLKLQNLVQKTQTAEKLFEVYEQSRALKDLYPLYEINIFLHELRGENATKEIREITTIGKRLVKMYDKINGRFIFTKILVY